MPKLRGPEVSEAKTTNQPPDPGSEEGAVRYDLEVDLGNANRSQTQLVLLCGENKRVLEVGPATGYVTKILSERGCKVTGIEIDAEAAEQARPYAEQMIVGDIEQLDFDQTLGDARFDVALYGDVLEHLVDPSRVLVETRRFLAPGGFVVASIPNIAHGSVRLALLTGQFRYTELGLLDRTHLRFFNRAGIEELFEDAGYVIRQWHRIEFDILETEVDVPSDVVPPHLLEAVRAAPEATTYQFIVVAEPTDAPSARGTDGVLADPPADLVPLWNLKHHAEELEARIPVLEAELGLSQRNLADSIEAYGRATGTRGYRVLQAVYRLIDRLVPPGTGRRKLVVRILGGSVGDPPV